MQEPGFIPDGNGHGSAAPRATNGHTTEPPRANGDQSSWACSIPQKNLILKIVDEHKLDKQEIESLSKDRFNLPVKSLNKLQASGLIEELLAKYQPKGNGNGGRSYQRGARR
jgi:hypothetical protein